MHYAWRSVEAPFYYLRAKKILCRYTKHYHEAQRIFRKRGKAERGGVRFLTDVGVHVVFPESKGQIIDLPHNYLELIQCVSQNAKSFLDRSAQCSFFPDLPAGPISERVEDIPAVKNGEIISVQLKNPFEVAGLEELCCPIMQELEQKIYGSYVIVDKVYVYRNTVSRQIPTESWLWHYDNHPHEVLKVLIYLTDVTETSAPFEYLRCTKSLKPVHCSPLTPLYGHSRVAQSAVARYFASGFESHKVTGPKGTMILFDNNVTHRANLASEHCRDVVIFQVRPATFSAQRYIDSRWTGSFQHTCFNANPRDFKPSSHRPKYFYW